MTLVEIGESGLLDLSPAEQARRHLMATLPELLPFEAIEVRCLDIRSKPAGIGPRFFLTSVEEVVEVAMEHRERWDVFYGVGTRACPGALSMSHCQHTEKGADHVSRLNVVWGDFDAKTEEEFDSVSGILNALALPPTVVVGSGTGLHGYWCLAEPTTELARVERVNRSLRLRLGADNAVDAARILRIAGTFNHKYGEPLPVRLLVAPDV
ncbi:MAG TPA: hypothetical protein VJB57_00725 [Dehalococcoidia bacterium]|nr:hypothetical protein [Dehalococcoidia bacterium]